jgi:hypothetical protein
MSVSQVLYVISKDRSLKIPGIKIVGRPVESCYGALAMCMIGCAGPPTPSKIRMYFTLVVAPTFLAIFTIGPNITVLR